MHNTHPYFHESSEHFSVCTAIVNCPVAAVTAIILTGETAHGGRGVKAGGGFGEKRTMREVGSTTIMA